MHIYWSKIYCVAYINDEIDTNECWMKTLYTEPKSILSVTSVNDGINGNKPQRMLDERPNGIFWSRGGLWWLLPLSAGENHRPAASHWQTLSHNVVSSTPHLSGIWSHNISDDRHRLHMIMTTTVPYIDQNLSCRFNEWWNKPQRMLDERRIYWSKIYPVATIYLY